MEIAIDFDRVSKQYRGHNVLSGVSFRIANGECIGLVGVNGAGKTTAIKCLLDFCDFSHGRIRIYGIPHLETRSRRRLTYLPEKFSPPYYLTGRDFLQFMADMHHTEYRQDDVMEMLHTLDLDPGALDKPVREYSKGMGQKLGLATCLLSRKDLFIFDEPMSGLDPRARALLKKHLLRIKQEGKTIFYSTHLLEDVEALCDRVIILHGGSVCFAGTTAECCINYQADNLETAYLKCVGS